MIENQTILSRCRPGLTLVEVLLASVILAITASAILTAVVAGHDASAKLAGFQQAHMLASNLMEEIKRFQNFENGDYAQDTINGSSSESGESCSPARNCFDDKTDFAGYEDGAGVVAAGNVFRDYAGNVIPLFTSGVAAPVMFRKVQAFVNDLGGAITDFAVEEPMLEIHVVVYSGSAGGGGNELVRLRQVFGSYQTF